MNNEFFIILGLFLLITFIISTIIVIFLSRIKSLSSILERAKEIDNAKDIRIQYLEEALTEEKILNSNFRRELDLLAKSKRDLKHSEEIIEKLKIKISKQEKEHLEIVLIQKNSIDQLNIHFELLEKNYKKLLEKYELAKKRNESLVNDNNRLNMEIREKSKLISEKNAKEVLKK
jgi:vacuolar-type H+-ATPase subunit I/STV1